FGGRRFRCGHHGFWLPETRIGLDPFVVWIAHFWTEPNQSCAVACNRRLQKFPPSLLPLHAERILECFSRAHRSVKIAKRFSGRKNVDRPVRSAVPPLEEDVVLVHVNLLCGGLVKRDEIFPILVAPRAQ